MELNFINWLQSFHTPLLDQLFIYITMLGEEYFYIFVLGFFYWCIHKEAVRYFVMILTFSGVLNSAMKEIVDTQRPFMVEKVRSLRTETAHGSSFPSGHTQTVTVFYGALAYRFKKLWIWIAAIMIITAVGLSRIYLGVHWPKDVVGGILLGILTIFIITKIVNIKEAQTTLKIQFALVILVLIGLIFLHSETYFKAVGAFVGFILGSFVEQKYIRFNEKGPWLKQLIKFIFAIVCTFAIFEGLKLGLPEGAVFKMLRYFLTLMVVTAGIPWLFIKLKLSTVETKSNK